MPAKSQSQRSYLFSHFGEEWVKRHHFDNEGKLPKKVQKDVKAAGVAVRAKDTGRVLMIQRSHHDQTDPARGTWEFPGGRLNEGEHPLLGARREWQEEIGMKFPKGDHVGEWRSGIYQGFIHDVPTEDSVKINADDRKIIDPDGDQIETAAWFAPDHLRRMSGLRPELRQARPWVKVSKELLWIEKVVRKLTEDDDEDVEKDVPAPQDSGQTGFTPSLTAMGEIGPLLASVHVKVPLKNISVAYMGRKKKLKITKADHKKQLIYGVVLEPNSLDSQDDYMVPDQVEKAAHTYMKKVVRGKASVSKLQHRKQGFFKESASVVPVQSFIAPVDFSYDGKEMVKKGTWVMVLHAEDENVWQDVMDGKYTGLSIGGTGVRSPFNVPIDSSWMAHEPDDWIGKEASKNDFAQWRDHSWEGS